MSSTSKSIARIFPVRKMRTLQLSSFLERNCAFATNEQLPALSFEEITIPRNPIPHGPRPLTALEGSTQLLRPVQS